MRWVKEATKALIFIIAGAAIDNIVANIINKIYVPHYLFVLYASFLLTVFLAFLGIIVMREIEDIQRRVGIKVLYVDKNMEYVRSTIFQEAERIVKQAQRSILVLNSFRSYWNR